MAYTIIMKIKSQNKEAGDKVRKLRKALGMNTEDFGALVGVSKRTVEGWEQYKRHPGGPAMKIMIAEMDKLRG